MANGYVYAVLFPSGKVKIGCSITPTKRVKTVATQRGEPIKDWTYSSRQGNEVTSERTIHEKFKKDRDYGEVFSSDFLDVCKAIKELPESTVDLSIGEEKRLRDLDVHMRELFSTWPSESELDPINPSVARGLELVNIPCIDQHRYFMLESMQDDLTTLDYINQETGKLLQLVELLKSGVEPTCRRSEDTIDEDYILLDVTAGKLNLVVEKKLYKEVSAYAETLSFMRLAP